MAEFESFLLSPLGLVQIGSFLVLISYMVKDFIKLRLSLIFANVFFLIPAIYREAAFIEYGFWPTLFILVNAQRIWVMYIESRPAKLDEQQEKIYQALFSHMKPKHFLRIYALGQQRLAEAGDVIVHEGQKIEHLRVIVSGVASVKTATSPLFLVEGQLIGEMGFLTGLPASAEVVAFENITYVEWSAADLQKEYLRQSRVEQDITTAIGSDLIKKLQSPRSEFTQQLTSPNQVGAIV